MIADLPKLNMEGLGAELRKAAYCSDCYSSYEHPKGDCFHDGVRGATHNWVLPAGLAEKEMRKLSDEIKRLKDELQEDEK